MELPLGTGEKLLKFLLIDHCAALPKGHEASQVVQESRFEWNSSNSALPVRRPGLRLVPKACTQLWRHQRAHFLYSPEDLFAQRCDRYVTKVSKRPRQETQ